MPAHTAAKKSFDLIRDGPVLLKAVQPLNEVDSLSLGISPIYGATCLALTNFLAEIKYTNPLSITFSTPGMLSKSLYFSHFRVAFYYLIYLVSQFNYFIIQCRNNVL